MRRLAAALLLALALSGCTPITDLTVAAPVQPHPTSLSAGCHVVAGKADRRCTPGARNPLVTQLNLRSTVCKAGWSATVRPPTSVTNRIKAQQMRTYGLTGSPSLYELDHIIPISAGGALADPANLYPQLWDGTKGAHVKDAEELSLHRAICGGRIRLVDAQTQVVRDWVAG